MPTDASPALARAVDAARFYRARGGNPIPSRADAKRPTIKYANLWDRPLSARSFEHAAAREVAERGSVNVQLMLGARWGTAVVDIDGGLAIDAWEDFSLFRASPPTWISAAANPDGTVRGMHRWYAVDASRPIPTRTVFGAWDESLNGGKGGWARRCGIEVKGDRSLIVAPPSVHPGTGMPYRWQAGCSPEDLPAPTMLPDWVRDLPAIRPPVRTISHLPASVPFKGPGVPVAGRQDWERVFAAIGDRVAYIASCGLRLATPNPDDRGWVPCRSIDREDRHASAGFHPGRGVYVEPGAGVYLRFFELAARLRGDRDWSEAVDRIGAELGLAPGKAVGRGA